jgi:hypothetical protein
MAGKLHKNYSSGLAKFAAPQSRYVRDYAEGYNARRNGAAAASNPHPAWQNADMHSDWWAWNQGWNDAELHYPPTHVGGPETFT